VWHTCHSSCTGRLDRRISVQACPGITVRPYMKTAKVKRDVDIAQVVRHLPTKCNEFKPQNYQKKCLKKSYRIFFIILEYEKSSKVRQKPQKPKRKSLDEPINLKKKKFKLVKPSGGSWL
jgi:hypothetical protein